MNCEQESEVMLPQETSMHSEFKTSLLNSVEIRKNPLIMERLNKLNDHSIKSQKNTKTVYSDAYDFTIETDYATFIESEDGLYHSYTFPLIEEDDETKLNNLVLSLQDDGSYKLLLVSYDLNNGEVDLDTDIRIEDLDDADLVDEIFEKITTNCIWILSESCSYGNPDHPGGYVAEGQKCPGYTNSTSHECISGSGSGSDDSGDGSSGSDTDDPNSGGSGGTNGSDTNQDVTIPTEKPKDELNCEGASDEIKADLLSVFGAGNFQKNCDLDINDSDLPSFNTLEELEAFAESLIQGTSENENSQIDDQNQRTAIFKFREGSLTYNVFVTQQLGTDQELFTDYDIIEVESNITGFTIFVSYEQVNWVHESMDSNVATVAAFGQATVSLIYRGIGQVIKVNIGFELKLDATDGSAISGSIRRL